MTKILCAAGVLGMLSAFPAMAGEWKQEVDGRWWYQNDDESYPVSEWKTIDGKEYYFGSDGYMVVNQIVDGKKIGIDGSVRKKESSTETSDAVTDTPETSAETVAATETAEATVADTWETDATSDQKLALKTLQALYKSVDDPTQVIINSIRCQTLDYINTYRVRKTYRICRIDYGEDFSDAGSRFVGYYESEVFTSTDTPVARFGGKAIREASDSVDMDTADLIKRALKTN
jgi:hypothetical protein